MTYIINLNPKINLNQNQQNYGKYFPVSFEKYLEILSEKILDSFSKVDFLEFILITTIFHGIEGLFEEVSANFSKIAPQKSYFRELFLLFSSSFPFFFCLFFPIVKKSDFYIQSATFFMLVQTSKAQICTLVPIFSVQLCTMVHISKWQLCTLMHIFKV